MKKDTDALLWFSIDTHRMGRKQIIMILKLLISFFFTQKQKSGKKSGTKKLVTS